AADPHDVAADGLRARLRQPRDGLGDVDGLAALRQRAEKTARGADADRDRLDHVGLDESRRDRVDGDVLVVDTGGEILDPADDAGLRRTVVRLAVVARDAGDRRDADDAAALVDEALLEQVVGDALG